MAAFCSCCGAEITLKAEACPVCGTPRHGMLPPELRPALDAGRPSSGGRRNRRKARATTPVDPGVFSLHPQYLDDHPFGAPPVKFRIEHPLPGAEVELAFGHR